MKRFLIVPVALLLTACSAAPPARLPDGATDDSPAVALAVSAPVPPVRVRPDQPDLPGHVAATLPAVYAGTERVEFWLPAQDGRMEPDLFLSPEGSRLAFTYAASDPETGAPLTVAAVAPLGDALGQARVVAWTRRPDAAGGTDPGVRIAGWLDERRLVLLRAATVGTGQAAATALRVEIADAEGLARTVGPWFSMGENGRSLAQIQVRLTPDRRELLVETDNLWRVDLPGVIPLRVRGGLSGPDAPGSLVMMDPGPDVVTALHTWHLYGSARLLGPAGQTQRTVYPPLGWLLLDAAFTPDGQGLILTAAQVTPDPTNARTQNRLLRQSLFLVPPDGSAQRLLWEGAADSDLPPWQVAGQWLLIDGRQIPLSGDEPLPLPQGVTGLPLSGTPNRLIAWQQDGALVTFAAGGTEAAVLARPSTRPDAPDFRLYEAGQWLLLRSADGASTHIEAILRP